MVEATAVLLVDVYLPLVAWSGWQFPRHCRGRRLQAPQQFLLLLRLKPRDLIRVAASCHHLRTLAASIMPCMKLKLFPHQEAAIEWMLRREQNTEPLAHPLCKNFCTEDGFPFFINVTSGEIFTGISPTINYFGGGMFCDEPGLGKTVTALSLILKTQGTLAEPPKGVDIKWCMHKPDKKYGYYEFNASNCPNRNDSLFE